MNDNVTFGDLFTKDEIVKLAELYHSSPPEIFVPGAMAIIKPLLPRIEKVLGQAMCPRYIAYVFLNEFSHITPTPLVPPNGPSNN